MRVNRANSIMHFFSPPFSSTLVMFESEILEEIKSNSFGKFRSGIDFLQLSVADFTFYWNFASLLRAQWKPEVRYWRKLKPMLAWINIVGFKFLQYSAPAQHESDLVARAMAFFGFIRICFRELRPKWHYIAKGHAHFMTSYPLE